MINPHQLIINTLSGEWCDNDILMLHACFHLLTDCIENENLFTGHVDWTHDEAHINAKKELEDLYRWWNERKKMEEKGNINDFDSEQYQKDNEMLIKLISVRHFLWT